MGASYGFIFSYFRKKAKEIEELKALEKSKKKNKKSKRDKVFGVPLMKNPPPPPPPRILREGKMPIPPNFPEDRI